MRIRTIKPEMWESRSFGRVSVQARLLFLACISAADDEGIVPWDAHFAKAKAFAYDDVSIEQVQEWMNELADTDLVHVYAAHGDEYAWLVKFRKHQRIDRPSPSKRPLPDFDESFAQAVLSRDDHVCPQCQARITDPEHGQLLVNTGKDKQLRIAQPRVDQPSHIVAVHTTCHSTTRPHAVPAPDGEQLPIAAGDAAPAPRTRAVRTP